MEADEVEMTREALQEWIREKVRNHERVLTVQEKCQLFQALLERRQKQATLLLKLCESVFACEAAVKKQYSLLGWEYVQTDSGVVRRGSSPAPPSQAVHIKAEVPHPAATNSTRQDMADSPSGLVPSAGPPSISTGLTNGSVSLYELKKAVVALTRLSDDQLSAFRRSSSRRRRCVGNESFSDADSDMQWAADGDSSDSDFCLSKYKRRKLQSRDSSKSEEMRAEAPQAKKTSPPGENGKINKAGKEATPAAPQATKNTSDGENGKIKAGKEATPAAPQAAKNTSDVKEKKGKPNKSGKEATPAASQANKNIYDDTRSARPELPQQELHVDMNVLAKRKTHRWQRGKILEIITREDGRVKYKVGFEESGKSLVSGHHIAFESKPTLEQLYVGARLVIEFEDSSMLRPGILAELPSRKNRLRFLVFLDDHKPHYVGLPALHLVCRPLENSLDDLPDGLHKTFMKKYLKDWPYPHLTHYTAGDDLSAAVDGVQQRCDVATVDCSLMEVVFQESQQKEWIHRGSMRLDHMQRYLEVNGAEEQK